MHTRNQIKPLRMDVISSKNLSMKNAISYSLTTPPMKYVYKVTADSISIAIKLVELDR